MAELFELTSINGMELKNRFVRSGTWTGMATEDGQMTPKLKDLIANVAKGGVGLVVPDFMPVAKDGICSDRQLGAYDDSQISGLSEMVKEVHEAGSKVLAQLVHGGAHSRIDLSGLEAAGPSAIPKTEGAFGEFPGCREMNQYDIDAVIEAYRQASIRCKQAGFDGVQIHCAHGYLFSQFLSPFYNKRTDQYGGSATNRARIVVDTYNQVRQEVGQDYPILVKLNMTDFFDGGITNDDALQTAAILSDIGIDAIETSGGSAGWGFMVLGDMNKSPMRTEKEEGYYRDIARQMKANWSTPIILTGGIRSYQTADQYLQENIADYIGLCRPLINEPSLINRWESGDTAESGCISCNGCGMAVSMSGKDLACVQQQKE